MGFDPWSGSWDPTCLVAKKTNINDRSNIVRRLRSHGIWSHHFTANRWGNNGNSDRLYFLGSKIIANGDGSHEIKSPLLLGRKVMTNLDSILKSRDITLPTNFCVVKAMFFPVVIYRCEDWTIKNVECWRTVVLSSCGAKEESWESLGQQEDQTSQF